MCGMRRGRKGPAWKRKERANYEACGERRGVATGWEERKKHRVVERKNEFCPDRLAKNDAKRSLNQCFQMETRGARFASCDSFHVPENTSPLSRLRLRLHFSLKTSLTSDLTSMGSPAGGQAQSSPLRLGSLSFPLPHHSSASYPQQAWVWTAICSSRRYQTTSSVQVSSSFLV